MQENTRISNRKCVHKERIHKSYENRGLYSLQPVGVNLFEIRKSRSSLSLPLEARIRVNAHRTHVNKNLPFQ